jgi:hypothetical protein
MSTSGASGISGPPPKKPAIVYAYDGGTTIALRLMSGRRKAICNIGSIGGDKPYITSNDNINLVGAIPYTGADRLTDRQLLISPNERFYYSDAGAHGTGSVQSIDLLTGAVTIANIASPFDGSFNLRRGYRGITKRMNTSVAHPNGYYTFWGLFWASGIDPLDFRKQGLVTYFKDDITASQVFGVLPPAGFADNDVIMSYDDNYIWMLCHDRGTDTFYITVVNNDFTQSALQNLPSLKNNLAVNQPVQFLYNDARKKIIILMLDSSFQVWNANANVGGGALSLSFDRTLNIPNVRFNDTATIFERLQPVHSFADGFFIMRNTNGGTSRSIARVSWSDYSVIEEFDFSNYLFQDNSTFPAPANNLNDIAFDTSTAELYCAFSNFGGGAERRFQINTTAIRVTNYF